MPQAIGTRSERQEAGKFLLKKEIKGLNGIKRWVRKNFSSTEKSSVIDAAFLAYSETHELAELQRQLLGIRIRQS
jgi:hypothetical protein